MKQKIVLARAGALGDVLVYRAAAKVIKDLNPDYETVMLCNRTIGELFKLGGIVDDYLPGGVTKNTVDLAKEKLLPCKEVRSTMLVHQDRHYDHAKPLADVVGDVPWIVTESYSMKPRMGRTVMEALFFDAAGDRAEELWPQYRNTRMEVLDPRFPVRYAVLHPGAGERNKQWEPDNYIEIGKWFVDNDYDVIITGTSGENNLVKALVRGVGARARSMYDRTLVEVASVVAGAEFVVCADCGVAHLASAVVTHEGKCPQLIDIFTRKNHRDPKMWTPTAETVHPVYATKAHEVDVNDVKTVLSGLL